jgi:hypothetical protein
MVNPELALAVGRSEVLEVSDPVGTGVVGAGADVLGGGEVGAGEVGVGGGVLGVGVVVGVGLVDGVGVWLGVPGVDEGVGAACLDRAGRADELDGCGVAAAWATTALPPLPALPVAASGRWRGRMVRAELCVAGGATSWECS